MKRSTIKQSIACLMICTAITGCPGGVRTIFAPDPLTEPTAKEIDCPKDQIGVYREDSPSASQVAWRAACFTTRKNYLCREFSGGGTSTVTCTESN